ncbi:formyltransferase family protein [Elusimicrobiota bacterium]
MSCKEQRAGCADIAKRSFLVFAKRKPGVDRSVSFLQEQCPNVQVVYGDPGDRFPEQCLEWSGDFIVSYISPWIIPLEMLGKARIDTVNFHPGPPEYPGIGCTNFALYHGEEMFGVTAHRMEARVDTGDICEVLRFPICADDSAYSLTERCYLHIEQLFRSVISHIADVGHLPFCGEKWRRKPYKRAELNALCRITADMSSDEVKRRVRATAYPDMPGPFMDLYGHRFEYKISRM